tara:strand:+ start:586 stop:996 length:411 start_codon:yes stop_codon:yes gene_type:complete
MVTALARRHCCLAAGFRAAIKNPLCAPLPRRTKLLTLNFIHETREFIMNKILNKAVTARFSNEDYLRLQTEAERRGCAIADVIRGSWTHYQQQQQLLKMEQRQRKVQFEMLCTLLGLNTDERKSAFASLQDKGVKF